jgi:hypothetical protein
MSSFVSRAWVLASIVVPSVMAGCASGGGTTDTGGTRPDGGPLPMDASSDVRVVMDDTGMQPDTGMPPVDGGPLPDAGSDGGTDTGPTCVDEDMDGFLLGPASCGELDCDDTNDAVNPGAVESCNGLDDDCNGSIDDGIPTQTCGVGACEATVPGCTRGEVPTCMPGDPTREVCNAIDDDCDGEVDDGLGAPITCGVGACMRMVPSCATGGMMMTCTPGDPTAETCNGIDDDCDGTIDDGLPDATCGVGACQRTVATCVGGMLQACMPGSPGTEICNGIDDDCDGVADDGFGTTTCGAGACQRTVLECVMGVPQMCMPGTPGIESCNNRDDDCDGLVDDGLGATSCGLGACFRTVSNCISGVPQTCSPGAPSGESCNGIDDDCNGAADDGLGSTTCGTGACQRTVSNCVGGTPQSCTPGTPAPTETCGNGIDDNCNGMVDDGCVTGPPNDLCAGAIALPGASGTRTGDSIAGATAQLTDCTIGSDLFYSITLSQRSIVYVDTFGSSFDTSISIRSSCAGAPVTCVDDACGGLQDVAVADLPAGTHFIVVHTRFSTTGTINLRWQTLATGAGTAVRATTSGNYTGTTTSSGTTSGTCGGSSGENLVYFTVCPSVSRSVTASTCSGATWDTVLYMRSSGGTQLACADDSCGLQSTITATATGPGVFGVFVDGFGGGSGSYTLNLSGL